MSRSAEFEAAHVAARDIQPGDYLDAGVKVRVHAARMIGDNFTVAHRLRGSKSPGITDYKPDQVVKVWRKKK
jgi:hypothetical protein